MVKTEDQIQSLYRECDRILEKGGYAADTVTTVEFIKFPNKKSRK
jgi:hypothetical protein